LRLAGLAALLFALPGCQSITGSSLVTQVRVIDASPDAPAMDIYQGGAALAYNLGFGTVTSYVGLAPGTTTITADTAGTKQQLTTAKGTFAPSMQYTMLIGNVAANLTETILTDQSGPAPSGDISVRILDQAIRYTGSVDVYLVPMGQTLSVAAPVVKNMVFGEDSGYINVPADTYSVVLVPTTVFPRGTPVPIYTGPQVAYSPSAARTLVLLDQQVLANPGFQVITADDYDSPAVTN
jgi:hypothetical protein